VESIPPIAWIRSGSARLAMGPSRQMLFTACQRTVAFSSLSKSQSIGSADSPPCSTFGILSLFQKLAHQGITSILQASSLVLRIGQISNTVRRKPHYHYCFVAPPPSYCVLVYTFSCRCVNRWYWITGKR